MDFLLVLIELFLLSVTSEAKIDRKSAISLQCGQFYPKFKVEGDLGVSMSLPKTNPVNTILDPPL